MMPKHAPKMKFTQLRYKSDGKDVWLTVEHPIYLSRKRLIAYVNEHKELPEGCYKRAYKFPPVDKDSEVIGH